MSSYIDIFPLIVGRKPQERFHELRGTHRMRPWGHDPIKGWRDRALRGHSTRLGSCIWHMVSHLSVSGGTGQHPTMFWIEFSSSFTLHIGMLFKPKWVRIKEEQTTRLGFWQVFFECLSFPTRYYQMYVKMSDFRFYEPVLGGQSLKVSISNYVCNTSLLKMSCHLVNFENQGPHLWSLIWELSGVDLLLSRTASHFPCVNND